MLMCMIHPFIIHAQLFRNVGSSPINYFESISTLTVFSRVDMHTLLSLRAPLPHRKLSQRKELYDPIFHCKVCKMIMKEKQHCRTEKKLNRKNYRLGLFLLKTKLFPNISALQ